MLVPSLSHCQCWAEFSSSCLHSLMQESIIMDYTPHQAHSDGASWLSGSNFLTRIMGFSFFAAMLQSNSYMVDSVKLFLLGTIIESGRRFCQWLMERFKFRQYKPIDFLEKPPLLTGHPARILHNRAIH